MLQVHGNLDYERYLKVGGWMGGRCLWARMMSCMQETTGCLPWFTMLPLPPSRHQCLQPDPALRQLLASIPLPKFVFTNADRRHAARCLNLMGLEGCFDGVICFEDVMEAAAEVHLSWVIGDSGRVGGAGGKWWAEAQLSEQLGGHGYPADGCSPSSPPPPLPTTGGHGAPRPPGGVQAQPPGL